METPDTVLAEYVAEYVGHLPTRATFEARAQTFIDEAVQPLRSKPSTKSPA